MEERGEKESGSLVAPWVPKGDVGCDHWFPWHGRSVTGHCPSSSSSVLEPRTERKSRRGKERWRERERERGREREGLAESRVPVTVAATVPGGASAWKEREWAEGGEGKVEGK
jgi:hypothetical protein